MNIAIRTNTIHAPSRNFVLAIITVATPVVTAPTPFTMSFFRQWGPFFANQRRTMPACDSVNGNEYPDSVERNQRVSVAAKQNDE